jgi:hypothetical protein
MNNQKLDHICSSCSFLLFLIFRILNHKLLKGSIVFEFMKACILLLVVTIPGFCLFLEELNIMDKLEYTVSAEKLPDDLPTYGVIIFSEKLNIMHKLEYTVSVGKLPDDLSAYDVIIISTPSEIYGKNEIQNLKDFVETGGGLMLLAEENNKDGTTLKLNQISQAFSITFNIDRVYDDKNYFRYEEWPKLSSFPEHETFEDVENICYIGGCSIEADGISVQSSENAYAKKYDGLLTHEIGSCPVCMVFLEMGKGRIFACGDKELFDQYLNLEDNTIFALNVFDWLAGNPHRISERLGKEEVFKLIEDFEKSLDDANEKGLEELLPEIVETAESLISEARILHNSCKYSGSIIRIKEAERLIEDGKRKAEEIVESHVKAAQECLSVIEEGAGKYLPSQYEDATSYIQKVDSQKTYSEKMDMADEALALCNEIQKELKEAAEKEINLAQEKVKSLKWFFRGTSYDLAQEYLVKARESSAEENYSDARDYAQKSEKCSAIAAEEQKRFPVLLGGMLLLVLLFIFLHRRRGKGA